MDSKDYFKGYEKPISDLHLHTYTNHESTVKMMESLEKLGVTDANMLAITYVDTPFQNNLTTMFDRETIKNVRLHAFGSPYYHPEYNNGVIPFEHQVQLLLDMGFDGIKLIDMKPNFRKYVGFGCNSPVYDDMFSLLEERGTPIVYHINDPERFWDRSQISPNEIKWGWWYGDGDFLSFDEIYGEVLERLNRNPKLHCIFAHFAYVAKHYDRAVELMETYPNIALDLTPGDLFQCFGERIHDWHDFFVRYRDRIYYGTDCMSSDYENSYDQCKHKRDAILGGLLGEPTEMPSPQMKNKTYAGLYLDTETVDLICRENYHKLFTGEHKPLRLDLFEEHTDTVCKILSKTSGNEEVIKILKSNLKELSK